MKRSAASLACEDASSTCVARHPSGSQTPSHGCLGKHADSIVVDTQAAGFECMNVRGGRCRHVAHYPGGSRVDTLWGGRMQYLRTHQVGSADFLPLDALRVKPVDDALRNLGTLLRRPW